MCADHACSAPGHVSGPWSASHGPNVGQPANQTADGTSPQFIDSELARAARASQRGPGSKTGQAPLCEAPSGPFRQRCLPLFEPGPNARDKISAIVKSRPSDTCRSVPQAMKSGAMLVIGAVGGGSMEWGSADVRSGRTAGCDRASSAPSTAKWRLRPSKKRHLAPFCTPFLMIFCGFFSKLARRGAKRARINPKSAGFEPRRKKPSERVVPGRLRRKQFKPRS